MRGNAKIVFVVPSFLLHNMKYISKQMFKVNSAHELACYHILYFFKKFK
jgi:hypothetical protein